MFAKAILVGALAALAAAQSTVLSFTNVPSSITVGQPAELQYTTNDPSSPVTITLRQGPATNLQTISTLTSDSTGGSYTWTPASSLVSAANYALQITQGDQVNYYGPFAITGGSASSSSSSASSSSSSASAPAYSSSSAVSASASASSTIIASYNSTTFAVTAPISASTGMPVSYNSTLSRATLTGNNTASSTGAGAATSGAGYQGTQTSTGGPVISTGGAASITTGGSALALVFGAVAAVLFC